VEISDHSTLLIYTPEITPRIEYAFAFIFQTILGADIIFTAKQNEFLESELPKINYSGASFSSGLYMKAHSILFESNISAQNIVEAEFRENRIFFASSADSFLPFDPFACAFYLLTRYEEYLAEGTDSHERFADSENLLVKFGLNEKPIVDQMAYWVAEEISNQFPEFTFQKRNFKFITTIDIDNAWAFKNKNILISTGAIFKAIFKRNWNELKQRIKVFLGIQPDPYDTYSFILSTYQGITDHLHFFFLMGDRNRFDKNISHKNKAFRELIGSLASVCDVGIHPSYASNYKPWLFQNEKERLEKIILKPVTQSRQHYLKLKLPRTYQNLIKSDISDDYTMGFASIMGFRAGTCTPFPFFDLSDNQSTELMIHPFQAMDVTLKDYLHLNPEKAWNTIEELMRDIKKVNGTFISLWHNETLKDSAQGSGWRRIFEQLKEEGIKLENE
jgi:hypothetical protein